MAICVMPPRRGDISMRGSAQRARSPESAGAAGGATRPRSSFPAFPACCALAETPTRVTAASATMVLVRLCLIMREHPQRHTGETDTQSAPESIRTVVSRRIFFVTHTRWDASQFCAAFDRGATARQLRLLCLFREQRLWRWHQHGLIARPGVAGHQE